MRGLSKAWLFIIWILSQIGLIGIMFWFEHFAYNGKHDIYDPYWVVPLQWCSFVVVLCIGLVMVALMIFPKDWFVRDAEEELKRLKRS